MATDMAGNPLWQEEMRTFVRYCSQERFFWTVRGTRVRA
jgi:hypothetical protein